MAFVVSAGTLAAVDKPMVPAPYALVLPDGDAHDYATIWRTQHEIRTVVSFLARNIAQLGIHLFRRVSDLDRVRLTDHPLAQLFTTPNPFTTRYRMIDSLVNDIGIYDAAFLPKVKGAAGAPGALIRWDPRKVKLEGDNPFEPEAFTYRGAKGSRTLPADQVVYFRGYNPTNPREGSSSIEALRRILLEEWQASGYREQLWRNGARMSGYLKRPIDAPQWSAPAKARFKNDWASQFTGDGPNAGGTPILEDGMDWLAGGITPEQAQYLEARKLTREEVAAAYHVPLPMVGILEHATFCLPGDSLVESDRGPVPISDVRVGDRVWSYGEDGQRLRLSRVTRAAQSGVEPVITVRTANRTVRMTGNHRVLTRWSQETSGSPYPNRQRYDVDLTYRRADSLRVGDLLVALRELPDLGSAECPTREVSEGFAEFCGLLIGDGSVDINRGCVAIARARHAAYMDHYRAVMRDEFQKRGGTPITLNEQERATRFVSITAARELRELGLAGTAHTKTVPGWVHRLSPKLRAAFVRGFLDADGSVDKKGRMSFSSCNRVLLEQIRHLCMGLGVPVTNLSHREGHTTLPNGEITAVSQWMFTCSDPGANRVIGSNDPRYVLRLAAGVPFRDGYYSYPSAPGRELPAPEGCQYTRVVNIERSVLAVPVYDITVEDDHCFVADGVVVHNSNIKEQHKQLYADCLGPWLVMIQEEFALQLVPDFPDVEAVYVEFNFAAKLAGSFEEQAAQLSSSVGAPWMTRNEARARQNLPQIDGGDELVTPLNVLVGGQASPADSVAPPKVRLLRKARPQQAHVTRAQKTLAAFFERQGKALVSAIGAAADTAKSKRRAGQKAAVQLDELWDDDRWNGELAADLLPLNLAISKASGRSTLAGLDLDPDDYDEDRTTGWLAANADRVAGGINGATKNRLGELLDDDDVTGEVTDLFAMYAGSRADQIADSLSTSLAGFGTTEAARQTEQDAVKTWRVTSGNPRKSHAAMDGESVALDTPFSNGGQWPGDSDLDDDERAGCTCDLEIEFAS